MVMNKKKKRIMSLSRKMSQIAQTLQTDFPSTSSKRYQSDENQKKKKK
jgi:hypothetical protein